MPRSFAAKMVRNAARAEARAACNPVAPTSKLFPSVLPRRVLFRQNLLTQRAVVSAISISRGFSTNAPTLTTVTSTGNEPALKSWAGNSWNVPKEPTWITKVGETPSWIKNGPLADAQSSKYEKLITLKADQRVVLIGFGAIGTGVLPLLHRHIKMNPDQVLIISDHFSNAQKQHAGDYKARLVTEKILEKDDLASKLKAHIRKGDILVNVSVDVSSVALIEYCSKVGALYIDTCNEPWAGGYSDPNATASERSNYAFREEALEFRKTLPANSPTAVLTHGANPGIVSHFVKQAVYNIARDQNSSVKIPTSRVEWANFLNELGVKAIHIAEKDTQASNRPKQLNEFLNTWSIEGFQEEGKQPAELGWGTHEREFPHDGERHPMGCQAGIFLNRPGALTPVRSWGPRVGNYYGLCITHTEAISIADYFTVGSGAKASYRPSVYFAYHASNDAMAAMQQVAGNEWQRLASERIATADEIVHGFDDLGVLIMGTSKQTGKHFCYWFGSTLSIEDVKRLVPNNNATSLQVCSGILSGLVWASENPNKGLVEPEEMDFSRTIQIAAPYLGKVVGAYTDWTPLYRRGLLFPEKVDVTDPWQFRNYRVL